MAEPVQHSGVHDWRLGEQRNARLQIYANMAAANADVATCEGRLAYVLDGGGGTAVHIVGLNGVWRTVELGGGGGGGSSGEITVVSYGPITAGASVVDLVLVDDVRTVEWVISVQDATPGANAESLTVLAHHDGTVGADATDAIYTPWGPGPSGTVPVVWSVDVTGAGGSQVMRLVATVTGGASWEGQVQRRSLST